MNSNGRGSSEAETSLNPTEVAGVITQTNWVNLPHNEGGNNFDGAQGFLLDSDGTETSVEFEWISNDAWSNDSGSATPDHKMMRGMQKSNPDGVVAPDPNSAMTFRWNNLLPGSTFNVVVYQAHNGGQSGTAKSISSIGGTTYYLEQGTAYDGTWTRSTITTLPTDAAGWTAALADYVQFDNVSPDGNGTIEIIVDKFLEDPEQADGMGVCGLQLELVSGAWPVVDDPPTITADPQDLLSIVGLDVTFTVGTDGPWDVEWFKNDASQGTGTDLSYSFTTVDGDKDATIYAIVSNPIGSVTSEVAVLTLDDPLPEQLVKGFMRGEHYGNIGGTVVFPDLYNHPPFIARDYDYEYFTIGGDVLPTDPGQDNFGRLMEGWVRPDTTEAYTFFGNSDDGFELFVNPTGGPESSLPPIPSNFTSLLPDATETSWQNQYVYFEPGAPQTTSPFNLTADTYYGVAMLYKEGTGGDHFSLAWRPASAGTPVGELRPIGPENVYCLASPAGKRASITNHPQSVTVLQGRTTTFEVGAATLPRPNEFAVQWTRDGANIPGETGFTYTTDPITPADDGAVIVANVYTLIGLVPSDPATITVDPDNIPPVAGSAGAYTGGMTVGIGFSEALDAASATDPFNYEVAGVTVSSAELLGEDDDVVALTVSAAPAAGVDVTVAGVTDRAGNLIANTTLTLDIADLTPETLIDSATNPVNLGRAVSLGGGGHYMEAGGSDIWDSRDAGYLATTMWTGAFDIRVRVESLVGPNTWTKAGINVRESADGGSRNLAVLTVPTAGEDLYQFQWRDTADAASADIGGDIRDPLGSPPYPNAWVRLVRPDGTNNLFQAYVSSNGVDWVTFGEHESAGAILPETLMVGLAATSHDNGDNAAPAKAIFRDLSITIPVPPTDPSVIDGFSSDGTNISVQWSNGGELESAPGVEGPWTGTGDSSGDYSEPLGPDAQKYYRTNQ